MKSLVPLYSIEKDQDIPGSGESLKSNKIPIQFENKDSVVVDFSLVNQIDSPLEHYTIYISITRKNGDYTFYSRQITSREEVVETWNSVVLFFNRMFKGASKYIYMHSQFELMVFKDLEVRLGFKEVSYGNFKQIAKDRYKAIRLNQKKLWSVNKSKKKKSNQKKQLNNAVENEQETREELREF